MDCTENDLLKAASSLENISGNEIKTQICAIKICI